MREFLQTAIPVMLTAVLAGQVAVTRTGRLRKDILANLDLLGRLPADCPNRAELEAKNGELGACWPVGSGDATGRSRRPGSPSAPAWA